VAKLGKATNTTGNIGSRQLIPKNHNDILFATGVLVEKKSAWEESVRLRERMFWTRIGGGVVPAFIPLRDSPRSATFANGTQKPEAHRQSEDSEIVLEPVDISVDGPVADRKSEDDPFQSKGEDTTKRVSIGNTIISSDRDSTQTLTQDEETKIEEQAEEQLHEEVQKSMDAKMAEETPVDEAMEASMETPPPQLLQKPALQRQRSTSNPPTLLPRKKEERLSLQIPGSFD
jgi:hypothetical protein